MAPSSPRYTWTTYATLAAICFLAHFLLLSQFGLYEDDYLYTLPSFNWSFGEWWRQAWDAIVHPIQARPLNHLVRRTIFALTLHGNSLEGAYLASWLLITANAILLHRLLARRLGHAAGVVAALLYLLHPADNARQIIMHQTDIHFGAFLLLASLNLFARERPVLAWIVGAATLVNYESFFLPLAFASLVCLPPPRLTVRRVAIHVAVWAAVFAAVAGIRFLLGETRAAAAADSLSDTAQKIASALYIGPGTSLRLLVQRPVDALLHLTPLLAAVAAVTAWLSCHTLRAGGEPESRPSLGDGAWWVAAGGFASLVITYLFAFRADSYPPVLSIGRLTALHAPGSIGTGIAVGALYHLVTCARGLWIRRTLRWLMGISFGLMAAFAVEIQMTEYVAHWSKQRDFWREILAQSTDVSDGDVILVDVEGSEDVIPITPGFPRFGNVNYPPNALRFFADMPAEWKRRPRVYGLWADTPVETRPEGLVLKTPPYFGSDAQPVLRDGNFLFFRVQDGRLLRILTPVDIRGHSLTPKSFTLVPPEKQLKPSKLYQDLFAPRSARDWFTVRHARNYPN